MTGARQKGVRKVNETRIKIHETNYTKNISQFTGSKTPQTISHNHTRRILIQ